VQFNGVPDAQTVSAPTTLIPMMEQPAMYQARIQSTRPIRTVKALSPTTTVTRRGNTIEFTAKVVHESIAISY
jgi:hypothetical protein